jgi:putative thiamine transport system ATP-binding protein
MSMQLQDYQLCRHQEPLFKAFSLTVKAGEIGAITGISGSGKSTLLADISGILSPAFTSRGEILLNGNSLRTVPIERRQVGILFQDDLLFPHLNVFENLLFGLPAHFSRDEKTTRIQDALSESGLGSYALRDIATLSGGQRARISLLRTLLSEPKLMLLDEPFSKLDRTLRGQFRAWVFEQLGHQHIPVVLVTHDPEDIPDGSRIVDLEAPDA